MPVSPTVCGLLRELSASLKLAVRVPVAKGVNVMLITQVAPGATGVPTTQVVVAGTMRNSVLGKIVGATVQTSGPAPVLVTVSVFGALILPTLVLPKFMLGGDRDTVVAATVD